MPILLYGFASIERLLNGRREAADMVVSLPAFSLAKTHAIVCL
jgi:hypothetical protein